MWFRGLKTHLTSVPMLGTGEPSGARASGNEPAPRVSCIPQGRDARLIYLPYITRAPAIGSFGVLKLSLLSL